MLLRIRLLFTHSFGLASTGGGSLDGDVGSGIFIGCPFIFSGKWLGLFWFEAPGPSSEDDSLPFSSSGSLKWTRSPALELDLGSLWFTRTPSSLGLGVWFAPWLAGVWGAGWCSVATKSMELVVWRAAALLLSSGAERGKVKPWDMATPEIIVKWNHRSYTSKNSLWSQLLHWVVWPCLFNSKFPWKSNVVKVEGKERLFQFGKSISGLQPCPQWITPLTTSLKCISFPPQRILTLFSYEEHFQYLSCTINHSLLCLYLPGRKGFKMTLTFDSQTSYTGHCAIFVACSTGETARIFWKYFSNNQGTNLLCKAQSRISAWSAHAVNKHTEPWLPLGKFPSGLPPCSVCF